MWFKKVSGTVAGTARDQPSVGARLRTKGDSPLFSGPQVVLNSGDGGGPLEMYRWDGKAWIAKTLIERLDHGHTLQVTDLNGDGRIDILQKDFQNQQRIDIWLNQGPARE